MDVVQNIFAAIIVLLMLIIAGIIYFGSIATETQHDFLTEQATFQRDKYATDLDSLIKLTEPDSQQDYGRLIADAIYYRNQTLTFNNKTINITRDLEMFLDCYAGEGRYYFEAKPRIVQLSMNFIIDGSKTLKEERERLAETLIELKLKMEKKVNETLKTKKGDKLVMINIYSLEVDNCGVFNNITEIKEDPDISCTVLTKDDLYYSIASAPPANITQSNLTIDDSSLRSFKETYGMVRPYDNDPTWWNSSKSTNAQYFVQSDWGFGTAYAIWKNNKTDLSKISIFFPMSDQLSTSSINDQCFNKSDYCQYTTCSLCNNECPFDRSLNSIIAPINASKEFSSVINPIFSFNCDYQNVYNSTAASTWNACYVRSSCGNSLYCSGFASAQPTTTWCADALCQGCSEQSDGSICFHEACTATMYQQMQQMANATFGSVIDLANISNINLDIENVINRNIEKYQLVLGYYNTSLPRDVVERTIPMPNNVMIDVRLWVYKDTNATFNCSFKD